MFENNGEYREWDKEKDKEKEWKIERKKNECMSE